MNPVLSMCNCLERLANVYFLINNIEEAYNHINDAYVEYCKYYGNENHKDCNRCLDFI